jgi:hypothetical protein
MTSEVRRLAISIGSCENFIGTLEGKNNCCGGVVRWQFDQHDQNELAEHGLSGIIHRPEPWAGNLVDAPVMFLSSNPSFDRRESFPTLEWSDDDASDFFIRRFTTDRGRSFGAIDGPREKDLDRVILRDGSLTGKVKTWHSLRSRAAVILDQTIKETLASRDYVMTEVVHCKSQKEIGVAEALPICVKKWLAPKLQLSSARLIVVSGSHAGKAVKKAIVELTDGRSSLPSNWGAWNGEPVGSGKWPKSWAQLAEWNERALWEINDQRNHIHKLDLELGTTLRTFTFMWMPHPIRSVPQNLLNQSLYHPELLEELRKIVKLC